MNKEYTIRKTHRGRETEFKGTMEHLLKDVFGYTIECGCSWNRKLKPNPKNGKALAILLNKCVEETQGGCFDQDYYELVG